MAIQLYLDKGCSCYWEEIKNNVPNSTVKGYTKVGEICLACKDLAVRDKAASEIRAKEMEKAQLISDKQRELAISELKKEGKLDSKGEVV